MPFEGHEAEADTTPAATAQDRPKAIAEYARQAKCGDNMLVYFLSARGYSLDAAKAIIDEYVIDGGWSNGEGNNFGVPKE